MGLRSASALVLLAAAGCAGGDEGVSEGRLPELVLQPRDLPAIWVQFDEGRQIRADAPPGRRADPSRFDRQGGWKARYRRPGSATTRGPLVIESRADLFATGDGAEQDLDVLEQELDASLGQGARRIEVPGVGEEVVAATARQGRVRFYAIAWRQQNVVAAIRVNGFGSSLTVDDAMRLARRQEQRIEGVAGS